MPARAGVHHVDLVVSSIERSLPFYRDLLAPLGYHHVSEVEGERGETIWYLGGRDVIEVGLREAQSEGDVDRYRVGLHHLAFEASTRAPTGSARTRRRSRAARRSTRTSAATTRSSSTTPTRSSSRSSTSRARRPEERST